MEVAGDFNQWEKVPLFLQCEEDESVWWTMLEVNILVGLFKLLGTVLRSCLGATCTGSWSMGSGRTQQVSTEGKCHFNLLSGAEVEENEDGELCSVLIVEEEEEEETGEEKREVSGDENASSVKERSEKVKGEHILEGHRRSAAAGTN